MWKVKLGLIRGAIMKKLTTSILIVLFSSTIFTPTHVEASWLSKTWKKIEKSWNEAGTHNTATETSSSSESAMYLPQRSEYPTSFRHGQVVGEMLDVRERTIAGIYPNATYADIRQILGKPTEEKMPGPIITRPEDAFMRYGGITYYSVYGQIEKAGEIQVINRDATTYRGIAVGDTLEQVYQAYGRPTYIFEDNTWFYGTFKWNTDRIYGIKFINDGERVTKILIL